MPEVTQGNGNLEFKFQNRSVPTLLGALLSALFFFFPFKQTLLSIFNILSKE